MIYQNKRCKNEIGALENKRMGDDEARSFKREKYAKVCLLTISFVRSMYAQHIVQTMACRYETFDISRVIRDMSFASINFVHNNEFAH